MTPEPRAAYARVVSEQRRDRRDLLASVADMVAAVSCPHPLRVAIDGPDAAGKTTLANELAALLAQRGREVIRASIDGFHRPRVERYEQGADSSLGYYEDSFDCERLRNELLQPLGPNGSRLYRSRIFDYRTDRPVEAAAERASDAAVLLFDGVFLLRPELADAWDFRIFVVAGFNEILRRVRVRDSELFGSAEKAERRYRKRYIPAQQGYFKSARPLDHADLVLINDDPLKPIVQLRP